ncbi:hypothetical protein Bbelb_353590 [Branchiostoma belcheri]|nr:hypothetical protein Bbelb_353590 [Branchiostoma belcheri]
MPEKMRADGPEWGLWVCAARHARIHTHDYRHTAVQLRRHTGKKSGLKELGGDNSIIRQQLKTITTYFRQSGTTERDMADTATIPARHVGPSVRAGWLTHAALPCTPAGVVYPD